MKRWLLWVLFSALFSAYFPYTHGAEETFKFGKFGEVTLYSQSARPSHVVLFISGDGGWNLGVIDMAHELTSLDAVVVGIDITHYLKELEATADACSYPAGDLELLSQFVQKKMDFPAYEKPVLAGYSSGATLAYAALVQAPDTFRGAISLGFCPDLLIKKPFCKGHGLTSEAGPRGQGVNFLPAADLATPWITLQGDIDQVCDPGATGAYVKKVANGELIMLPKVGHGFSVTNRWMPQFREAFTTLVSKQSANVAPRQDELNDLPLIEIPATVTAADTLAIILSGDGGWAGLDKDLAHSFAGKGISTIGFDSLQYFWQRRTPEGAAHDLDRIINHYRSAWKKNKVILIGYSFGADVLPFMINKLSKAAKDAIQVGVLLGPEPSIDFEIHVAGWLPGVQPSAPFQVLPEVTKISGTRMLCLYGYEENDSICPALKGTAINVQGFAGGHHFNGDYHALAEAIFMAAGP